ncbi:DUF58 domain-containing protein [Desulfoluna butyratoxydans]|uniref:von willebrand factor type a n=1 Tax=Desulfoluna butyratoxydans TaxID=231438 RepID=A0A4U8YRR5_9BACT|nr:DUF58 domain-containing protein [Desulfoluna butyratoxydans]VFQ47065.1 von willebrand factor type a [Desulfoluna butyratoxydans]
MLPAEVLKKIKRIHIRSRRMADTMMAGHYRSVFKGAGMEFEEVREYTPGDEIRSIDWKVSARMGRPFIKQFREEREMVVMLLIDMSRSGFFGTGENLKVDKAAEVASVIAFNAIKNGDKVGAIFFTDRVEQYIPPKNGSAHIWRVIREIFTFTPSSRGTDIEEAVAFLARVCRKRTVSFVISDFLSDPCTRTLRLVGRKHELISILLSDPGDFLLPSGGLLTTRDFETGRTVVLDVSSRRCREKVRQVKLAEKAEIMDEMKRAGLDVIELSTEASTTDALTRYFTWREGRRR